MIAVGETVGILLAAGRSTRFGRANKLLAPLNGRPLIVHAASVLATQGFASLIAVVPPRETLFGELLRPLGFGLLVNSAPGPEQRESLMLALRAVIAQPAVTAALVCLGDMPFVKAAHLHRLIAGTQDAGGSISAGSNWRTPPVLFTRPLIDRMVAHSGELRDIVMGNEVIPVSCSDAELRDFDTVDDFHVAR